MNGMGAETAAELPTTVEAVDEHAEFVRVLRNLAPFFIGFFCYLVGYGLFMTFGLVALLGFSASVNTMAPSSGVATSAVGYAPAGIVETARSATQILAVFGAFLTLWPAWFCGYVVRARLQR